MRKTRAIIHLGNLRHNIGQISRLCPESRLCLAVKADAYGHGAVPVAQAAIAAGAYALGVATAEEALELRQAGILAPIILYGIAAPAEMDVLIAAGIELFCTDPSLLNDLAASAARQGNIARIHLKVDTGMGRIGCRPEMALEMARLATGADFGGAIRLVGICTHFPVAEDRDTRYTQAQIARFLALVAGIRQAGIDPGLVHAANSGGLVLHHQARLDMVRPGIVAYGYAPGNYGFADLDLRPVMELRSPVSFIKQVPAGTPLSYGHRYTTTEDSWIGTVALGYADGLHRTASGKLVFAAVSGTGPVRRFPQVGTICMDQCLVNLGPASAPCPVNRWDELAIFGPQSGSASAADLAEAAGTISYEILCGISRRVPRVFADS